MPFWVDAREKRLVDRFETGAPWKLNALDKSTLAKSWGAESKIELRDATQDIRRMVDEGKAAGDTDCRWRAYRNVWRYMSPRWDIWEDCLDRAIYPPKILGQTSTVDAHTLIHHVLAVASRRNPQLQLVSSAMHSHWAGIPIAEPISPTFTPLDDSLGSTLANTLEVMRKECESYTDNPATMSPEHSYLQRIKHIGTTLHELVTTQTDVWERALKTTRRRLDVELRKEEGVSQKQYWLPVSAIAIRKHEFPYRSSLKRPKRP